MIRGVVKALLIVSALAGPLYCGDVTDGEFRQSSRVAVDCSSNRPAPCHDGCGRVCICQGMMAERLTPHSVAVPRCLPLHDRPSDIASTGVRLKSGRDSVASPTHPRLLGGADIRLAFASLLL